MFLLSFSEKSLRLTSLVIFLKALMREVNATYGQRLPPALED